MPRLPGRPGELIDCRLTRAENSSFASKAAIFGFLFFPTCFRRYNLTRLGRILPFGPFKSSLFILRKHFEQNSSYLGRIFAQIARSQQIRITYDYLSTISFLSVS